VELSAALIVRDEEAVLADCLQSIRDVVDEIIVVDTGSVDESRRIARAFGARLIDRPWRDDFAAARNEALDAASGHFILYIDADERLLPTSRGAVEQLLADPSAVCHTVLLRPQRGYTRYREHRIFRNDARIRFRGVIHETMLPGIEDVAARDGLRIVPSPLAIEHVGYEGDQRGKHRRNLPLLKARLAEDPRHVFSWHHLGRALLALGDPERAVRAWRAGIEVVRSRSESSPPDSLLYGSLLRHEMDAGGGGTPGLLEEGLARFPGNHLLAWLHGRRLVAEWRFEEAIGVFERLAAIDGETFVDDAVAYDARIFGAWALDALGLCCFRLGRFAESARHYAGAEAAAPDRVEYRTKRRLAEARGAGARS
jgi:glycosyltransferase involved in cell wall biosynthesis